MAFGWGPQGGLMSGGEHDNDYGTADGKNPHDAELTVSMETPARDLYPGQTQEAFFWTIWGYEQEDLMHALEALRKNAYYQGWERKIQSAETQGVQFECRDPYLTFLFSTLKAWVGWMKRKDGAGNVFGASGIRVG